MTIWRCKVTKLDQLFEEPVATERPLRILVYGLPKTGKSHLVATATEVGPLFWQDTEGGSDYYDAGHGYGFRVLRDRDPMKTVQAVELASPTGGVHPVIAVDSFSSTWFGQQEVAEELTTRWSRGKTNGRASFRAWGPAKKPLKKLYDVMHSSQCHIIITARAKNKYEVGPGGEPKEVGLVPDVERNLAYAVDLVVEVGIDELKKGVSPKPENFHALVVGSRSANIPIGRVFQNPKFSDFLPAVLKGKAPEKVGDSVADQVQTALDTPQSWPNLERKLKALGWSSERAKELLVARFGPFDAAMLEEYWVYLKGQEPEQANGTEGQAVV